MKHTVRFLFVVAIALAFSHVALAQGTRSQPSRQKLAKRFDHILETEFESDKVTFSFAAARHLDQIVQEAADRVIQEKAFAKLPRADKAFKTLAQQLKERGERRGDEVIITNRTLFIVLRGHPPNQPGPFGLCPLFPICR